jgi:hypothetical protein
MMPNKTFLSGIEMGMDLDMDMEMDTKKTNIARKCQNADISGIWPAQVLE